MAWHSKGYSPASLGVRFVLELCALVADAYWGWHAWDSPWRYVLVVVAPLLAATAWGVFNVPGDRTRSGKAPVPVPGPVRLAVEVAVFGTAVAALADAGATVLALCYAAVLVVYHATAYDRIRLLLGH